MQSKENIKPIATDMPKESLHNPIDKQFFNSPILHFQNNFNLFIF